MKGGKMKKLILILAILIVPYAAHSIDTYEKGSESALKVESTKTETKTISYEYQYLLNQKTQIEKDMARVTAELAEINKLIVEADKLGVTLPEIEQNPRDLQDPLESK